MFYQKKSQTWFTHMPPVGFLACSASSNLKFDHWANLYGQMAIFTLFGPFLPPSGHIWEILGLANGVNWSALMSSVPFQPHSNNVPLNRWPHIALTLAHYVLFLGPCTAQVCETPCAQAGTEVSAYYGIRKKCHWWQQWTTFTKIIPNISLWNVRAYKRIWYLHNLGGPVKNWPSI